MKERIQKNNLLMQLIADMKKLALEKEAPFWKRIAVELEKPTRHRRIVNISRINQYSQPNEMIIVPGKVLSSGTMNHPVTVFAYSFSKEAEKKIGEKGKAFPIQELMKTNPKASNVRILG